jgi:iron complex transport system ATP-binding protein
MYELDGVSFAVNGRTLLHPLSLRIEAGRVHGLIGLNGSGKSTLLKLLARQQRPGRGTIRCGGMPLERWGSRAFARKVGYLPQQTPPTGGMTVRELAALGRYPWHGALGRFGAADRDKVEEALNLTQLHALADREVDSLSGGERQRVWLAMLVAQDTECLLLDEPTAALDVAHQVEVLGLVQSLSRQRGLCVVTVLHDVNMAARFCDEILALRDGRLLVRGTPAEVMNSTMLEAIYDIPMSVVPHPRSGIPVSVAH